MTRTKLEQTTKRRRRMKNLKAKRKRRKRTRRPTAREIGESVRRRRTISIDSPCPPTMAEEESGPASVDQRPEVDGGDGSDRGRPRHSIRTGVDLIIPGRSRD